MEKLKCKACGAFSMMPMDVMLDDAEAIEELGTEKETRFYTCHVCGDNWLSIKETDLGGQCQVTFVHQMGTHPLLKRVAFMQTPVVLGHQTVDHWIYYEDEDEIAEDTWKEVLDERRRIMRSASTN